MDTKKDAVIDLELGAKILGRDKNCAKKMISLMLESFFQEDKIPLEQACKQKKWHEITNIVDKLNGGLLYCGTPRLRTVVTCLSDVLKIKHFQLAEKLCRQFINEIMSVEKSLGSSR
ncbi:MAG: hypothetical protein ACNA7Y_00595 [Gammaproteobacteria bacterium]